MIEDWNGSGWGKLKLNRLNGNTAMLFLSQREMAENIQFHSDMADEHHIGEAVGTYVANKCIVHLYAPVAGYRSVPAVDAAEAERIFWDFIDEADNS